MDGVGGGARKAVVNVGYSPTFVGEENREKIVEAHLLGDAAADFYGKEMRLILTACPRPPALARPPRRSSPPGGRRGRRAASVTGRAAGGRAAGLPAPGDEVPRIPAPRRGHQTGPSLRPRPTRACADAPPWCALGVSSLSRAAAPPARMPAHARPRTRARTRPSTPGLSGAGGNRGRT